MTTIKPLLCFQVEADGCDAEDIEIIFARSSIEAKRRWSNEHWNGDEIAGISASRKPGWDKYAPGPVPALEMIDAGWWTECHGCGTKISTDYIGERMDGHYDREDWDLDLEYGPDLTLPIMQPVELSGQRIWCRAECRDHDLAQRAMIKRWEERVVAWMGRRILSRFPDATILPRAGNYHTHCYVSRDKGLWTCKQVIVGFTWPGQKIGPASLRIDSPDRSSREWRKQPRRAEWSCCNGDRDAFETYAKSTSKQPTEAAHA